MENLSSVQFRKWYKNTAGSSVTIDLENRKLQVYDSKGESIAILNFASNVDSDFDLSDLFKEQLEPGDYEYHVFPGLHFLSDTLWRIRFWGNNNYPIEPLK